MIAGCAEAIAEESEAVEASEDVVEPKVRKTDDSSELAEVNEPVEVKEPVIEIKPAKYDGELPVQLTVTDIDNIMFLESIFGSERNSNSVMEDDSIILPEYAVIEVDSAENTLGGEIEEVFAYKIQDKDGNDIDLDLFVYPIYDKDNDELLREYATYCEITEDGIVVDKGFFPVVVEGSTLKIISNEAIEFPELTLDENDALIIPNIYQNQDNKEVEAELSTILKEYNKNNPKLYENTDENKIPDTQVIYCDGVGNVVDKPIYPVNENKVIIELLEADQEQIDEIKEQGYIVINDTIQPVENDNYNSPVCVIVPVESIIIPVVVTAKLNAEGGLVFAGGAVVNVETKEPEENKKLAKADNKLDSNENNSTQTKPSDNIPTVTDSTSSAQTVPAASEKPAVSANQIPPAIDQPGATSTSEVPAAPEQSTETNIQTPSVSEQQASTTESSPTQTPVPTFTPEPKPVATSTPKPNGHYEQVWVVDVPAETVEEPVYETKYVQICNKCGAVTNTVEEMGIIR